MKPIILRWRSPVVMPRSASRFVVEIAEVGYFETVHGPDSWSANPWAWLARARRVQA